MDIAQALKSTALATDQASRAEAMLSYVSHQLGSAADEDAPTEALEFIRASHKWAAGAVDHLREALAAAEATLAQVQDELAANPEG